MSVFCLTRSKWCRKNFSKNQDYFFTAIFIYCIKFMIFSLVILAARTEELPPSGVQVWSNLSHYKGRIAEKIRSRKAGLLGINSQKNARFEWGNSWTARLLSFCLLFSYEDRFPPPVLERTIERSSPPQSANLSFSIRETILSYKTKADQQYLCTIQVLEISNLYLPESYNNAFYQKLFFNASSLSYMCPLYRAKHGGGFSSNNRPSYVRPL